MYLPLSNTIHGENENLVKKQIFYNVFIFRFTRYFKRMKFAKHRLVWLLVRLRHEI